MNLLRVVFLPNIGDAVRPRSTVVPRQELAFSRKVGGDGFVRCSRFRIRAVGWRRIRKLL